MTQKGTQSRTVEKLARHLHSHILSMWNDSRFVRLTAAELADRSNFVFIGSREERTEAANEMVIIAERYFTSTGNNQFEVVAVRVERKNAMGYDGDEVQLLLKPNDNTAEFVLIMFAASHRHADYFTHELLPFAQFSARAPLLEEPRQVSHSVSRTAMPASGRPPAVRTARPIHSFVTNVGTVTVDTRTDTVSFRNCSYSLRDHRILVSGKQAASCEDVPRAFVSAVNAIKTRAEVTIRIADEFQEDYARLRKKEQRQAKTGSDGRKILEVSEGAFSILENGTVIYTSNKAGFACEYVPGMNMLLLDRSIVRRHRDIPHEFLRAVAETRELGYAIRNGIADAVLACIPPSIRKNIGANVIAWCLRHKDSSV